MLKIDDSNISGSHSDDVGEMGTPIDDITWAPRIESNVRAVAELHAVAEMSPAADDVAIPPTIVEEPVPVKRVKSMCWLRVVN